MGALAFQVNQLEKRADDADRDRDQLSRDVTRHEEQISGAGGLVKAMEKLGDKVDSLNKALYTFAGSFMIAAVTIGVAIATHA